MRFTILALAVATVSTVIAAPAPGPQDISSDSSANVTIDDLQAEANENILATLDKRHEDLVSRGISSTCNSKTVSIRKE